MNQKLLTAIGLAILSILASSWLCAGRGQADKTQVPAIAPVDKYLMDRNAEIALARSAAPAAISGDAKILVLGRHGYETAVEGQNGFVCAVERSWMSPFDDPEFWNPKIRGAICFNPPAARSLLLAVSYKRTELALAGLSKEQIHDHIKAAYARNELPSLEAGSMCFMMSKQAYLNDVGSHHLAHLMLYAPLMDGANWGADVPNSPVILGDQGPPEPYTEFIIPIGKWSDGTPAALTQ